MIPELPALKKSCPRLKRDYVAALSTHLKQFGHRGNKLKEKIQLFLQDKITFVQLLNSSEPFLIVSSNLNEAAMRSLLKESNVEGNVNDAEYEEELNNDDVEAVDLDAELLSWLYRKAVKVHHNVKLAPGIDCIGSIDEQSTESVVLESLFMLISLLCAGDQEDDVNKYLSGHGILRLKGL